MAGLQRAQNKSGALRFLSSEHVEQKMQDPVILHGETPTIVRLAVAQEQLWNRHQRAPVPLFFNESVTVRHSGPLDVLALERAVNEVFRRHEIWRTTFKRMDGVIVQVVSAPSNSRLRVIDLRKLNDSERESVALRMGSEIVQQPYNLESGPLVRIVLFRLADEQHWLLVAAHQIVVDGVSLYQILLPELTNLYQAYTSEELVPLEEPQFQFRDFAYHQRLLLTENVLERQLGYWKKQLAGAGLLHWPSALPSSEVANRCRGYIQPFAFPRCVAERAQKVSQEHRVTLFITLTSAFTALLHCYTNQTDILLGTVLPSGRELTEAQQVMGYLLNPVALRASVEGDPSFSELLRRIRRTLIEALDNDDVPFESVVRCLNADPDENRNSLVRIAVSLEPVVPDVGPGWDLTPMDFQNSSSRWDLYFVWEDRPTGLTGRVQYNPDIFNPDTVATMLDDFRTVLEAATHAPQRPLSYLRSICRHEAIESPSETA
jgi:hypothetical protein